MPFLLVLGLAAFASSFSTRAVDPMLNILAVDLKVTIQDVALLASAFTLPYAVMQMVFGPIGDAVGKVRLIRVNLVLLSLGLIASALAASHAQLMAARVFSGAVAGGIIPVTLAIVGDRVGFEARPVALSRILLAIVLGQLIGAALSGVISQMLGWRNVFWTACAITVAAGLASGFAIRETGRRQPLSFRAALERYALVLRNPMAVRVYACVAVEGAAAFGIFPLVAPLMVAHGFGDAVEAGIVIAGFAIGGAGYTFAVTWLVRRLGLAGMAGSGAALAGLLFMMLVIAPDLPFAAVTFALAGFTFYMLHNTLQILATEIAPEARGSAMALFATAFFSGQALGAVATAHAAAWLGIERAVILAGAVMLALAIPAALLVPRKAVAEG